MKKLLFVLLISIMCLGLMGCDSIFPATEVPDSIVPDVPVASIYDLDYKLVNENKVRIDCLLVNEGNIDIRWYEIKFTVYMTTGIGDVIATFAEEVSVDGGNLLKETSVPIVAFIKNLDIYPELKVISVTTDCEIW